MSFAHYGGGTGWSMNSLESLNPSNWVNIRVSLKKKKPRHVTSHFLSKSHNSSEPTIVNLHLPPFMWYPHLNIKSDLKQVNSESKVWCFYFLLLTALKLEPPTNNLKGHLLEICIDLFITLWYPKSKTEARYYHPNMN